MSCGVLVTDGSHLLLGHATGSPRWDIPKGLAEPGEDFRQAAVRELREETGLLAPPESLTQLGLYRYRPGKDLALFTWRLSQMPDPDRLSCASTFVGRNSRPTPEFDRFAIVPCGTALTWVGRSLAAVLDQCGATMTHTPPPRP